MQYLVWLESGGEERAEGLGTEERERRGQERRGDAREGRLVVCGPQRRSENSSERLDT